MSRTVPVPPIAVGVMAYNEERNIGRVLSTLLAQTVDGSIRHIVVVASGCTDRTCAIAAELACSDSRIELIAEPQRAGKIAAINAFLQTAQEPIAVISSADLVYESDTIEHLCVPLLEPAIGMTGSHPVPLNTRGTFAGFAVNVMWELHDYVARRRPKIGEVFAFRRELVSGPLDTGGFADEHAVESQVREAGFDVAYAGAAIVYNQGPATVAEFFQQRRRWIATDFQGVADFGVEVATLNPFLLLASTVRYVRERRPRMDWLFAVACIEALARVCAFLEFHVFHGREKYRVWAPVSTTKSLTEEYRSSVARKS